MSLIPSLADARRSTRTGSKAVNLSRLIEARLAVPRGFVIGADAYRSHLWASGVREIASDSPEAEAREHIRSAILSCDIPEDIWIAVSAAYERLSWQSGRPDPKVAVRSSALEDAGARPGFAGAYESYLNISGIDELREAIKRVWASLWNGRAAGYRAVFGLSGEPAMAVIVQEMIEGQSSGTVMTANPVTGNPNRMIISWARGGSETVDCEIDLSDMTAVTGHECAAEPLTQMVADQAILVEGIFETQIEVEWTYDGERLWFLQAQPMTDLPVHFPVQWPEAADRKLEWRRASVLPVSPISRSVLWEADGKRTNSFDARRDMDRARFVNGYVYRQRAPIGEADSKGDAGRVQAKEIEQGSRMLSEWRSEVLPELRTGSSRIIGMDLCKLDHPGLMRAFSESVELARNAAWRLEEAWYPAVRFPRLLREFVGSGTDQSCLYQRLMAGLEHPIIMRDARLQELGERFGIAEASGKLDDGKWWSGYSRDVAAFARDYGYAFANTGEMCDFAAWTSWVEDHDTVFRVIGALSRLGDRPSLVTTHCAREQLAAAALAEAESMYEGKARKHLQSLLSLSKGWLATRAHAEESCALAFTAIRLVLIEIAGRLVRSGVLACKDDVFHLTARELLSLSAEPGADERRKVSASIARRKHELWLEGRLAAPEVISAEDDAENTNTEDAPVAHAWDHAASPGVASGRARVAASVAEAGEIESGDILVIRSLAPAWTPFFALAGGLVCEEEDEAFVSCIAQEYGVPAVVGFKGAMATTGRRLAIDGESGTVEVTQVTDGARRVVGAAHRTKLPSH